MKKLSDDRQHIIHIIRRLEGTKIPKRESSDLRRGMFAIFFKSVDSHDGKIRIIFSICGEIEVYHLLHDLIIGK